MRPICAADHGVIQFNRDALGRERKQFEKPDEVDVRRNFALFAVEINIDHISIVLFETKKRN